MTDLRHHTYQEHQFALMSEILHLRRNCRQLWIGLTISGALNIALIGWNLNG